MQYTTNYQFKKPEGSDVVNIQDINENIDKIDGELAKRALETDVSDMVKQGDFSRMQEEIESHLADYVRQPGYAITGGTNTAYTVTLNPAPTAYVDGMCITIMPHIDCGTAPTLNINGLGALTIVKRDGTSIAVGDFKANNPLSLVRVGSNFFIRSAGKYDINSQVDFLNLFNVDNLKFLDNLQFDSYKLDTPNCIYKYKNKIYFGTNTNTASYGHDKYNYIYEYNIDTNTVQILSNSTQGNILPPAEGLWNYKLAKIDYKNGFLYVQTGKAAYNIAQVDLNNNNNILRYLQGPQNCYAMDALEIDSEGYIYIAIGTTLYKYNSNGNLVWQKNILTGGEYFRCILGDSIYTSGRKVINRNTGEITATLSTWPNYKTPYGNFDVVIAKDPVTTTLSNITLKKLDDAGNTVFEKVIATYQNSAVTSTYVYTLEEYLNYNIIDDKLFITFESSMTSNSYTLYTTKLLVFDLTTGNKILNTVMGDNKLYYNNIKSQNSLAFDFTLFTNNIIYSISTAYIKRFKINNYTIRR